jgi:hypothetical protein
VSFIRRHPVFTTIMVLFALLIAGEIWYLRLLRGEVAVAERAVHERIAEIEQIQQRKPAPTNENVQAARTDFAQQAEVLATMLRVLNVTGPDELEFFRGEPATRPDAWFEVSQFVDRMTKEARKANVQLRPDERFGFSAYTYEGPEPAYIQSVYRQHRIVEYLLGRLFAARPRALIGVQREEPRPLDATPEAAGQPKGPTPARAASGGASTTMSEIFAIDPQVSARTPGYVDTLAFRVIFSGHTSSLRAFMNALAAPDIPLVVRSVEVREGSRGLAADERDRGQNRPANPFQRRTASERETTEPSREIVPIVAENASEFTVTIELFDVKIRAPEVAIATAGP